MRFATNLHAVETLAIYTNHGTLANEGVWVYFVYQLENGASLTFLCKHEEHLYLAARIESLTIDDSTATAWILANTLANLLVFL